MLKVELAQLPDTGFLRFWDHRRLVDSRTGAYWFLIGSHTEHRPLSHVRALESSGWVLTAPYGSALKTIVHCSCGLRTGSVRCLEILTGPTRAVTTDYGRFVCGCSQARKASARARTVPTRSQRTQITQRTPVCMSPCTSTKDDFIRGLPKSHRPLRLPKSYGLGPLVGIMRCCGHMHTGALWVSYLHVLLSRGCKIPYMYLTSSIRFTCGYPRGHCGFHTAWEHPYVQFCGNRTVPCRCRARTISGVGPYGVRWGPWVHARVIFTKPNTIMWHMIR